MAFGHAFHREGDGQENRRLVAFSFRFLNRPSEKPADCAQECAQTRVPKTISLPTIQSTVVVAFSVEGCGLNGGRLDRFAVERFRVTV
jgi:hypothetical protein